MRACRVPDVVAGRLDRGDEPIRSGRHQAGSGSSPLRGEVDRCLLDAIASRAGTARCGSRMSHTSCPRSAAGSRRAVVLSVILPREYTAGGIACTPGADLRHGRSHRHGHPGRRRRAVPDRGHGAGIAAAGWHPDEDVFEGELRARLHLRVVAARRCSLGRPRCARPARRLPDRRRDPPGHPSRRP